MSDSETENPPIKKTEKKKRVMTEEQLERLAKMREKAMAVRKANKEKRLAAAAEAAELKEIEKKEKKLATAERAAKVEKKLKEIKTKRPVVLPTESSSEEEEQPKPIRRKKKKMTIVPDYSDDSDTEIVIRKRKPGRPSKSSKTAPASPLNEEALDYAKSKATEKVVNDDLDEKIRAKFEQFKKEQDDDEVIKLIRHMLPSYKK